MEKHPLYFFIDLIEGRKIADLKYSFHYVNPELTVVRIDEKEEYIQYLIDEIPGNEMIGTLEFSTFIADKMAEKKGELLSTVDLHFLNNLNLEAQRPFIIHINNAIDDLIIALSKYPDAGKYPVIEATIKEIKDTLSRRYLLNTNVIQSLKQHSTDNQSAKLKWNAGVASLCTLFYELSNDYKIEKKGTPFLTASYDQLIRFVSANFVDEDGNPFSENSIKTYIDSRADKKAKRNRVEIGKIIPNSNEEKK